MAEMQVSLIFPVYKDERTVRVVADKALELLAALGNCPEQIFIGP